MSSRCMIQKNLRYPLWLMLVSAQPPVNSFQDESYWFTTRMKRPHCELLNSKLSSSDWSENLFRAFSPIPISPTLTALWFVTAPMQALSARALPCSGRTFESRYCRHSLNHIIGIRNRILNRKSFGEFIFLHN